MGDKVISQRKKLAAVFASFAVLIVGTVSLLGSMAIDYYSVINTVGKIVPSALILGSIGWVMGMILDKPHKRQGRNYNNNLILNELLKNSFVDGTTIKEEGPSSDI